MDDGEVLMMMMMMMMMMFDGIQVLTWGCGAKGQLGYGMERALLQTSTMGEERSVHKSLTPRPIACLGAFSVTQVECMNTGMAACCTSHGTEEHVTRHMSHVIRHTSHVTRYAT